MESQEICKMEGMQVAVDATRQSSLKGGHQFELKMGAWQKKHEHTPNLCQTAGSRSLAFGDFDYPNRVEAAHETEDKG